MMIGSLFAALLMKNLAAAIAVGTADVNSLKFVHAIWRHGDRTPSGTFPTDPNQIWREGFGELTTVGMMQQWRLGQFIRQRYRGFFSPAYDSFEIYVRSTDYNRTIMSALANMAGFFYPPDQNHTFLANLSWHPVPVHTRPKLEDQMLWMDRPCPKVNDIVAEVERNHPDFFTKWKDLIDFLEPRANVTIKNFYDIWAIYDPIFAEWQHKAEHPPPAWVNETIYKQIVAMYYDSTALYYSTPEWQRLRGGLLMNDIAQRLEAYKNGSLDRRLKYFVYSAHDTTSIAVQQSLGVYAGRNPPYASAIFIELHEIDGVSVVKFFYRNETNSESDPYELHPTVCRSSPCTLAEFRDWAKERAPGNWAKECGIKNDDSADTWKGLAIAFGILAGLFAVLFIFMLWTYLRAKKFQPLYDPDGELLQ